MLDWIIACEEFPVNAFKLGIVRPQYRIDIIKKSFALHRRHLRKKKNGICRDNSRTARESVQQLSACRPIFIAKRDADLTFTDEVDMSEAAGGAIPYCLVALRT